MGEDGLEREHPALREDGDLSHLIIKYDDLGSLGDGVDGPFDQVRDMQIRFQLRKDYELKPFQSDLIPKVSLFPLQHLCPLLF